jgi:hypothetical protein
VPVATMNARTPSVVETRDKHAVDHGEQAAERVNVVPVSSHIDQDPRVRIRLSTMDLVQDTCRSAERTDVTAITP